MQRASVESGNPPRPFLTWRRRFSRQLLLHRCLLQGRLSPRRYFLGHLLILYDLALRMVRRWLNICILSVSSSRSSRPVNSRYASSSVGLASEILVTWSPFDRIKSMICGVVSSPCSALILYAPSIFFTSLTRPI